MIATFNAPLPRSASAPPFRVPSDPDSKVTLLRLQLASPHGPRLPCANHGGGRVRRWRLRVQIPEHEHGPPEEDEAEDLVCTHPYPEERPVEDDRRCREGELRERRVGGPGAGETPVVQEQGQKTRDQGEEDNPSRRGGEPGAQTADGTLRYHYGREQRHGQEQTRAGQGVEGQVLEDEAPEHGRGAPQQRGAQGQGRGERFGGGQGHERSQISEGDQVRPHHRYREARPVSPPQPLAQQDGRQRDGEERLGLLQQDHHGRIAHGERRREEQRRQGRSAPPDDEQRDPLRRPETAEESPAQHHGRHRIQKQNQVLEEHYLRRRRHLQQGHPQDAVRPPHRRPDGDEQDAGVASVPPTHALSHLRPVELGYHTLAVGSYELLLVAAYVVDVDFIEAKVYVVLDVLEVLVEVGRHQDPILEVLDADLLSHRCEVLGGSYVRLGKRHPAIRPLLDGLLLGLFLVLGPGDVKLYHARHLGGVFVRATRALLELLHQVLYLLTRGADGDDAVAELARPAALYGARCRDVDRGRSLWHGVEPRALELYVLAAVLDDLPREESAYNLDGLHEDAQAGRRLGPVIADDVLVQRLARAEAEPEASRVHSFQRRRTLGDYGRMVPKARRGHARTETEVRGGTQSAHPGPHEGALTLIRGPGMEVVRGHDRAEPRLLSLFAPPQQLRRVELLEHRSVANGARGFHEASFVGSISASQHFGWSATLRTEHSPLRLTLVYSGTNSCRSKHAAVHQQAEVLTSRLAKPGGLLTG